MNRNSLEKRIMQNSEKIREVKNLTKTFLTLDEEHQHLVSVFVNRLAEKEREKLWT